jgi:hypothetical protein
MWCSRRLRRAALRGKLRAIANTDVLSAFIGPYCRQLPVNGIVGANPLTLDDELNVTGIGEKTDRIANGKRGLRRRHDRWHVLHPVQRRGWACDAARKMWSEKLAEQAARNAADLGPHLVPASALAPIISIAAIAGRR